MLLAPLQNTALQRFISWIQLRPFITQLFGLRPETYKRFGLKGHNGIDLRCKPRTPLFAPMDGEVKVGNSPTGYGKYVKLRGGDREVVLAHLSHVYVKTGDKVKMGDRIVLSGNTGFSSAPHLHFGMRNIIPHHLDIFDWEVKDRDNGFNGWLDIAKFTLTWKGTLLKSTHG